MVTKYEQGYSFARWQLETPIQLDKASTDILLISIVSKRPNSQFQNLQTISKLSNLLSQNVPTFWYGMLQKDMIMKFMQFWEVAENRKSCGKIKKISSGVLKCRCILTPPMKALCLYGRLTLIVMEKYIITELVIYKFLPILTPRTAACARIPPNVRIFFEKSTS